MSDDRKDQADHFMQGRAGLDVALQLQKVSTLLIQEGNIDALYERVLDAAVNIMSAGFGSLRPISGTAPLN